MPAPGTGDVYVAPLLSNILVSYIQTQDKYVAPRLFPLVPVDFQQGIIPKYDIGDFFRDEVQKRAAGTPAEEVGWKTSLTTKYYAEERAIKHLIPDQVRATTQSPFDQDRDATLVVGQKMLIKRDVDFAAAYWKTGVWGKDWTGANAADSTHKVYWDVIGSTPIEDVKSELDRIESITGFRPNKLALSPTTWTALENNAEFLDRIRYGGTPGAPAMVTAAALAQVFGVDEVIRAAAVKNSAAEGATNNINFITGRGALLVYAPPAPSIFQPSAGYTFAWKAFPGAPGDLGFRIKKYRWEIVEGDYVEGQAAYDMQALEVNLGVFFSNIVSS